MLREITEVFKSQIDKNGEDFIYDNLQLSKGTYVLVSKDKKSYEVFNIQGKNDDIDQQTYKKLCKLDYLSSLLDMNKPVDSKKTIHSNNYMSFFIKKDNLKEEILSNELDNKNIKVATKRYFESLKKMTCLDETIKGNAMKVQMYNSLKEKLFDMDEYEFESNKTWIEENVLKLKEHEAYADDKGYLKIFFDDSVKRYENERNRYVVPKIYNSLEYNVKINDVVYGLPNNDMQLNSNKPSLKLATRKNVCPILISLEDALLQEKLFLYLRSFLDSGNRIIYINENGFFSWDEVANLEGRFNGHVLKLKKGMSGAEIKGFSNVCGVSFSKLDKEFNYINALSVEVDKDIKFSFGKKNSVSEFESMMDSIVYCNTLRNNYFNEDIKVKNSHIKRLLILTKDNMLEWFRYGKSYTGYMTLRKFTVDILMDSLSNGFYNKAKEQFNFMYSLEKYFEGENSGENEIEIMRESLADKVSNRYCEDFSIESDKEYYYAVGQLAKFLLSRVNSKRLKHSELNGLINSRTNAVLVRELEKIYKRNNRKIFLGDNKFSNLYFMVLDYTPESTKIDSQTILCGFLDNTVIRRANKEKQQINNA